jgi:hypothetical protein
MRIKHRNDLNNNIFIDHIVARYGADPASGSEREISLTETQ